MMPSKPLPFVLTSKPKPKIAQRKEAKRMSLVAGFAGYGGFVLCADKQETVQGYAKREVEKIEVRGNDQWHEYNIGVGVATDSGPFADKLTQDLLTAVRKEVKEHNLVAIETAIENSLTDFHAKHIWPRASQDRPHLETLIAVQPADIGPVELFHTVDTAVNYVADGKPRCIGVGGYLASYILETIVGSGASKSHLLACAAYLLKEVGDNVDGCGKAGTIWFFGKKGECDEIDIYLHEFLESQVPYLKETLGETFQFMTDSERWDGDSDYIADKLEATKQKHVAANEEEALREQLRRTPVFPPKDGTSGEEPPF